MDNSPSDTNSRINPFSIDNILSPPSSQTMQNVVGGSNQPHPQLYYMAFMLQQQLQQQQHFRHLQHFQQQQQQQYLQTLFLAQLQQQQQQQQQQHQLLPHKQQHQQQQQEALRPPQSTRQHHQMSHRHLMQAQQQHLQQASPQQQQQQYHHKQSSQKSHIHHNQASPTRSPLSSPVAPASLITSAARLPRPETKISSSAHGDEQSTALSSLSSFVAKIEPLQALTAGSTPTKTRNLTSSSLISSSRLPQSSGGGSPAPGKLRQENSIPTTPTPTKQPVTPMGAITTPTPTPLNSTINTAINIAKAPPELVQKQPAWVFCTRYSDRPSSGPRTRRAKSKDKKTKETKASIDEKRPRTAFTNEQLEKLRQEFQANSYLDEKRRKDLAERLCLNENQIKIWFQNKRAKMKKQSNQPNPLRGLLVAGGLYNHSTATSDCSESYANGNDGGDDDDNVDDDNNNITTNTSGRSSSIPQAHKRPREQQHQHLPHQNQRQHQQQDRQQCNSGKIIFNNTEAETGMMSAVSSASKRIRVDYAASDAASESSRNLDDLDEDEQVISVS